MHISIIKRSTIVIKNETKKGKNNIERDQKAVYSEPIEKSLHDRHCINTTTKYKKSQEKTEVE